MGLWVKSIGKVSEGQISEWLCANVRACVCVCVYRLCPGICAGGIKENTLAKSNQSLECQTTAFYYSLYHREHQALLEPGNDII